MRAPYVLVALAAAGPHAEVGVGDPAPPFVLPVVTQSDAPEAHFVLRAHVGPWAGDRAQPVVLVFVASWAEASTAAVRTAAPASETGPVVAVITDAHPENVAATRAAIAAAGVVAVVDRERVLARRYGARALPLTVVIGPDGRVEHLFAGAAPETRAAVRRALRLLEPSATATSTAVKS